MTSFILFGKWLVFKAWPWLKAHWLWVVCFPLALVIYFAVVHFSQKVVVVAGNTESDAAKQLQKKIEEARLKALAALDQQRLEESQQVISEHREAVNQLTEAEQAKASELLQQPDKLNDFLLDVGRRMRQ